MAHPDLYKTMTEKFPFITYLKYGDKNVIGIVQNKDQYILTIYDYETIPTPEIRKHFLELGDTWWWESNRLIPINIFLKADFKIFKPYAKTFSLKDIEIIHGPIVSINEFNQKRVKSRSIQLVRKITS